MTVAVAIWRVSFRKPNVVYAEEARYFPQATISTFRDAGITIAINLMLTVVNAPGCPQPGAAHTRHPSIRRRPAKFPGVHVWLNTLHGFQKALSV
jgi:hypothetical protein